MGFSLFFKAALGTPPERRFQLGAGDLLLSPGPVDRTFSLVVEGSGEVSTNEARTARFLTDFNHHPVVEKKLEKLRTPVGLRERMAGL